MFGRKKEEQLPAATPEAAPQRPGAKNRPTPSRREAEAARRRPIVPADRDAAKKESRARERQVRYKHREAMMRGEEWALHPRDKGAERRFVRDIIDARWNVGEFLLPVMIIGLPISLLPNQTALLIGYTLVYGMLFGTIFDVTFLIRRVKTAIRSKFGSEPQRGTGWYVFSRAVQLRGGRVPRPRVKRGGEPL